MYNGEKNLFIFAPPENNPDYFQERCRSGLTGTPGERVCLKRVPGVRIPLSPHSNYFPRRKAGVFVSRWPSQACLRKDSGKQKLMSERNKEVI